MKCAGHKATAPGRAVNLSPWFLVICLLLPAIPGKASAQVTAAYQHLGGRELAIRIEVGSPPPSSLILVQKLPPGTDIVYAEPPAEKVNRDRGEAKWFFRQLRPGILTVSFSVDRDISPADVSGQIRFKSHQDKRMEVVPVSKP